MKKSRSAGRRLRMESLETRQMLAVLTVAAGGGADFTTIQAAVNAATAGDKIKVKAGTYAENVVVNKQLKIVGEKASLANATDSTKATIVDPINNTTASSAAIAFDLQADGIEIKGFTVAELDSNTDPDGTIGIRTSADHSGYEIEDNVIQGHTIGIYLNSDTSTTADIDETEVEDNVIRNNNRAGTNTGNGIYSDQGLQNAEIEDNLFTGTNVTASIKIVGASGESTTVQSDITIKKNDFESLTGGGIYFENVVNSVIKHNDMTALAKTGIQLNGGNEGVTIKKNDLESVGTSDLYGILLSDLEEIDPNTNNLIKKNHVTGAGLTGIQIENSSSNTLERNKIKGSLGDTEGEEADGNGISLVNADNNILKRNKVKENARHGIFLDSASTGNSLIKNKSKDNDAEDLDGFDYDDETTGGTGPSNTQNTYDGNKGVTQNVTGLIDKFI